MTAAAVRRMTVKEFLVWDGLPDRKYELLAGVPMAMAPATGNHQLICGNLAGAIHATLRKKPHCVMRPEAGILVRDRDDTYYQPDIVVACGPKASTNTPYVDEPLLIVEVLSPGTEDKDRKTKLPDYRQVASVQEILLVDSQRRYVEVHRRQGDGRWLVDLLRDEAARLTLDSIGLDAPLSAVHANVVVDDGADRARA
ncbi:MAG: Uma2 family endonuclease [Alphaproteobacteria bacterium]|nr:Uma2 family endonuclease [Alphaproteobacteria bacterium]